MARVPMPILALDPVPIQSRRRQKTGANASPSCHLGPRRRPHTTCRGGSHVMRVARPPAGGAVARPPRCLAPRGLPHCLHQPAGTRGAASADPGTDPHAETCAATGTDVDSGAVPGSSVAHGSLAENTENDDLTPPPIIRGRTRLQSGIMKPLVPSDGMVRYEKKSELNMVGFVQQVNRKILKKPWMIQDGERQWMRNI